MKSGHTVCAKNNKSKLFGWSRRSLSWVGWGYRVEGSMKYLGLTEFRGGMVKMQPAAKYDRWGGPEEGIKKLYLIQTQMDSS